MIFVAEGAVHETLLYAVLRLLVSFLPFLPAGIQFSVCISVYKMKGTVLCLLLDCSVND